MKYFCFRSYPNGEIKYTIRDRKGMISWIKFNTTMRPGNTLYVNGKKSFLSPTDPNEKVNLTKIKTFMEKNKNIPIFEIGEQIDFLAGKMTTRTGYPDDRTL